MKKMEVYARYSKGEVWPNHAEKSSLFVWDSVLDTHQKKVCFFWSIPASPCTPWDGQYTSQPIWSLRILYQTLFGSNTHSLAGEVPVRPMRRMMRATAFCFPVCEMRSQDAMQFLWYSGTLLPWKGLWELYRAAPKIPWKGLQWLHQNTAPQIEIRRFRNCLNLKYSRYSRRPRVESWAVKTFH